MPARLSDWMDRNVWDGLVRAFGGIGQIFGILTDNFDERGINAGIDEATTGTRGLGRVMSAWHSGQIQTYLRAVAKGFGRAPSLKLWRKRPGDRQVGCAKHCGGASP